jgi:branched-chain amino acid aminotransferase
MTVQLFAVEASGPRALAVPAAARHAHELFDGLELGVYSALRTFGHERFLGLERHFERTDRSLELLGSRERLPRERLARAIASSVRAYPAREAFVRFDLLTAPARKFDSEERCLLALSPLVPVPEAFLEHGVTVQRSPLRRARPLIKVARFVVERRPYPLGTREAYEHLILDESGRILEGTSSNFLAIRNGRLHLCGDEALQGITQHFVAELAGALGLECVRDPVALSELPTLDEAFLTGSTRGIVPVAAVETQPIGNGSVGPWTRRLRSAYDEYARAHARSALAAVPSS